MKAFRLSLLLVLLCSLLLCGCAADPPAARSQQPVTMGFTCDMEGSYRGTAVAGQLSRSSVGLLTVRLSQPEDLSGLEMEWNGEKVMLRMFGLSVEVEPDTVPESALGVSILQSLDAAMQNPDGGTLTDAGMKTVGSCENGSYELISDPETGHLRSLSVPALEFTARFSNFQTMAV